MLNFRDSPRICAALSAMKPSGAAPAAPFINTQQLGVSSVPYSAASSRASEAPGGYAPFLEEPEPVAQAPPPMARSRIPEGGNPGQSATALSLSQLHTGPGVQSVSAHVHTNDLHAHARTQLAPENFAGNFALEPEAIPLRAQTVRMQAQPRQPQGEGRDIYATKNLPSSGAAATTRNPAIPGTAHSQEKTPVRLQPTTGTAALPSAVVTKHAVRVHHSTALHVAVLSISILLLYF